MTKLKEHIAEDEKKFCQLQSTLVNIRDNHLAHIASDIKRLDIIMSAQATDIDWLKKAMWWVIGLIGLINITTLL